jgi:ketosteroid isomerase-like protein
MSAAVLVGALACGAAPFGAWAADTVDECNKREEAWKDAYNKQDPEALAQLYDSSSGMYSNPFWSATGHDALVDHFKKAMSGGAVTITSLKCDQTVQVGNLDYADGTWAASAKNKDGTESSFGGHWLIVYKIRDGKFVILRHNGNLQK